MLLGGMSMYFNASSSVDCHYAFDGLLTKMINDENYQQDLFGRIDIIYSNLFHVGGTQYLT